MRSRAKRRKPGSTAPTDSSNTRGTARGLEDNVHEQDKGAGPEWVDLPSCLWELIATHLDVVDRCHLAVTCSDMNTAVRSVRPNYSLPPYSAAPLLVSVRNNGQRCSLLDPVHNEEYLVNTVGFSCETRVVSSKGGWLLMLTPETDAIFFFNPLTKARMDLPSNPYLHGYTFSCSAAPTSPDCFVLAIMGFKKEVVAINFCRRGDEEWVDVGVVENAVPFLVSHSSPVFLGGRFYCLGEGGAIGVFDSEQVSWTVLSASPSPPVADGQFFLVESHNTLLRVFVDPWQKQVEVCEFNPSTQQWARIQSLGDTSLFVGGRTSISLGERLLGTSTRGRIYFQRLQHGKCVFYCHEEATFHPRKNFYGSEEYPRSAWIEANWGLEDPNPSW